MVGACKYGTYKRIMYRYAAYRYIPYKYAALRYITLPGLKFRGFGSTRIRDNIADIRHSGNIEEQPVKTEAETRMRYATVTA